MSSEKAHTRFDTGAASVVIEVLTLTDECVVQEARHWTSGRRGPRVDDPAALEAADLSTFAREAVALGARALSVTAQSTHVRELEQMLKEVGQKSAAATVAAAEATGRSARDAADAVTKAAAEAKKAIAEDNERNRKALTEAVEGAKSSLLSEITRQVGGDNPELLERLRPVLDKFAAGLQAQAKAFTGELVEKAVRQFDPTDPASPMAKQTRALAAQQEKVIQLIEKNHAEVGTKVDELTTALRIQEAKTSLAKVTPIKGGTFEEQIHDLMRGIAAGLADEYEDTTHSVGLLPRSKKGDGTLHVAGSSTRVVLEMTDSARACWSNYFDEAERNRGAAASVGIVRTAEQNDGQAIRVLGPRRVVLAFDPKEDDPELLRTVVMLLRAVALTATARTGGAEIATAEERITEAISQLDRIDTVKRHAGTIQKSATKIESECTTITAAIHRLLDQAMDALAGTSAAHITEASPAVGAA